MSASDLVIRGAREHNLRNVDLVIPRNQLVVLTGVSGSGKSSLAFDTVYAEGQRRYVESLSTYARQFLGQMPKPDVDSITGLAPSISIQQKSTSRNPRSTVGTITEVYDYLRVLYARVGTGCCVKCQRPITAQSTDQILESILTLPEGTKFQILAPLVNQQKGEFRDLFADLLKQGYLRARVDGEIVNLSDDLGLKKHFKHTIEVVIDRLVAGKGTRTRLAEAIEAAARMAEGKLLVALQAEVDKETRGQGDRETVGRGEKGQRGKGEDAALGSDSDTEVPLSPPPRVPSSSPTQERLYSTKYACPDCGLSYEPPSPQLFSFNSPLGMCPDCTGLGQRHEFLLDRIIADETKSIAKGALHLLGTFSKVGRWRRHIYQGVGRAIEQDVGLPEDSFLKTPWSDLPDAAKQLWLHGTGDRHITFAWRHRGGVWKHGGSWAGFLPELLDDYIKAKNPMRRKQLEKFMATVTCSTCHGERLNAQARNVRIEGRGSRIEDRGSREVEDGSRRGKSVARSQARKTKSPSILNPESSILDPRSSILSLPSVCSLSIDSAARFFSDLVLTDTQRLIAEDALKEIRGRLGFLQKCGLGYLTLDRTAPTLSGGESQRIRLAGQIGCGLVGVLYVLDEPSIGLHPRDNSLLLQSLEGLRDQGNTVLVVEHDEETMEAADHIIDFGPGPGVRGGEIVAQGTVEEIKSAARSLTGAYLSGRQKIEVPKQRREIGKQSLKIVGARHNNLRDIDVDIPLGVFVCVTGVSGSGKSSLCNDILWEVLNQELNKGQGQPGAHTRINGLQHLDKAIDIDQSPIGRTPRSNPATYVKLFDEIRDLYTQLPQSKVRGYKSGRFSFNVADGRCEACEGHGATKLEMDFLADIWVPCAVCGGQRFNHETLEVKYRDKSIADVLDMDVQEALEHFKNHPKIHRMLQTLHDVGLDYLKLGQPSPTLSGGEAQRIKLARELGKRSTGRTLYLLDEPTTGLHFEDVRKLLEVLHGFADAGNTVLVIEHNLDVVKTADWIIDLGPEGGSGGGRVLATGTPEEVAECGESHTGRALQGVLRSEDRGSRIEGTGGQGDKGTGRRGEKGKGSDSLIERGIGVPLSPLPLVPSSAARRTTASPVEASAPANDAVITIKGAAQHNLQSIDVTVPRDQMSVFCGPSGSGKTSLAMDTLYAEGQRRYVESLSAYARQFLGQMPKPKLEHISGLSPAIAIEQKTVGATPRSTVGTVTEIYDYLRILFARLGTMHCPEHGCPVTRQTTDEIVERVLSLPEGTRIYIGAPLAVPVGQSYKKLWDRLGTQGYLRVRINGETHLLEEVPEIDHKREHTVEAIIDRIQVNAEGRPRIADSIETALDLGKGVVHVIQVEKEAPESEWRVDRLSLHYSCSECGGESVLAFEDLSPQNFSFNSPLGWCEACQGLGVEQGTNQQALVASPGLSLRQGAVSAWPRPEANPAFLRWLEALAAEFEMPLDTPWYQLDPRHQRVVLYGSEVWIDCPPTDDGQPGYSFQYKGLYPAIEEASRVSYDYRLKLQDLVGEKPCSVCNGDRVRPDAAAVRLENHTLPSLCKLPLVETLRFLESLQLTKEQQKIAGDLLNEATHRLKFLVDVGLHYLTLDRGMPTLSGGESQRIRLAGQIGRALTGVLYVLDEPTIGLHPRDNGRLIEALHRLRDLGNTVVLVEHDQEVLASADRLYDFGPGSGRFGGTVTAEGTPQEIVRQPKKSLTGAYLSGEKAIPIPTVRRMTRLADAAADGIPSASRAASAPGQRGKTHPVRGLTPAGSPQATSFGDPTQYDPPPGGAWLEITNCRQNNLRGVDLRIPLGALTCVTGLSGSGKSSLIQETLARAVARKLNRTGEAPGPYDELRGVEQISRVINVDQAPIGMTPASNPATYVGVFDPIRDLFSKLPDSKIRGYKPGRFSFNRPGGRCEECEGLGQKKIEMHFLPDVWVTCDACRGHRYNAETLTVRYKGSSISDVLNLPIGQALELFGNIPKIRAPLATLAAIGLDYLTLGQSATTLSGGEAQRVKLAAELCKPNSGRTLYLLDEPTTGLHMDDIAKLLMVLGSLVEQGNTVVVIEHNLDVIKTADWVVDIGPEAGIEGGQIVVAGTPEEVVEYARDAGASVVTPEQRPGRGDKGKRRQGENSTVPSSPLPLVSSSTAQRLAPGIAERVLASPRPRSYTGELLAPVLAKGRRGKIEVFDVAQEAAKRSGDVDIAKVGKEAALPWKVDGRKWHTQDRPARNGKVCKWEGAALEFVVDLLGEYQGLKEVNWNDPSTVEVTAEQKTGTGWFFHALTGDEWLVRFYFRVPKKTFDEAVLARDLNLKPVDEMDEVQVYGRGERVKFNNSKGPFQEVVIDVYRKAEIDTPAFREFIEQAVAHYVEKVEQQEQAPAEAIMPWKVLGKKWHLSRKGFPSNKRVYWSADVLEKLLDVLEQSLNGYEPDWSNKTQITWKSADGEPLVELQTKRREGVFLTLLTPPGRVALGQIADLGTEREIVPHRRGQEAVRVKFTDAGEVSLATVAPLLKSALGM